MAYVEIDTNKSLKRCRDALGRFAKNISGASPEIENNLRKAWNKVKTDAVIMCPKKTGSLASTIRVVEASMVDGGFGAPLKSITLFDRAIIAGDLAKINPQTKGVIDYAPYVHDGYITKDGRMYMGTPFLSYPLAANEERLVEAIDQALRKLGMKYQNYGGGN